MDGREYLAFTRKERNGIIALLLILMLVALVPMLLRDENSVVAGDEWLVDNDSAGLVTSVPPAPNTYRNEDKHAFTRILKKKKLPVERSNYASFKKKKIEAVEINSADTSQFIALPFIGSKLAARIVLFREKLGGFVEVRQLGEVYGLQDSIVQKLAPYLTCNKTLVRRININELGEEELGRHPYIRWQMAKILTRYRKMHGSFGNVDDLKKIEQVEEKWIRKIEPYLDFGLRN